MDTMSSLKDKLQADLSTAIKSRDEVRTRTIRMALTAITNEEVSGSSARELTDDEIIKVLSKEAKKRREAAEAFANAGRQEKADAELAAQHSLRHLQRRRQRPAADDAGVANVPQDRVPRLQHAHQIGQQPGLNVDDLVHNIS